MVETDLRGMFSKELDDFDASHQVPSPALAAQKLRYVDLDVAYGTLTLALQGF